MNQPPPGSTSGLFPPAGGSGKPLYPPPQPAQPEAPPSFAESMGDSSIGGLPFPTPPGANQMPPGPAPAFSAGPSANGGASASGDMKAADSQPIYEELDAPRMNNNPTYDNSIDDGNGAGGGAGPAADASSVAPADSGSAPDFDELAR